MNSRSNMSSPWGAVLLLLLALAALAQDIEGERDGKWFLGGKTVTKTIKQKVVFTEMTPSSCVVVERSLPPCRNLRQLRIEPTSTYGRITPTATPMEPRGWSWFQDTPSSVKSGPTLEASEPEVTKTNDWGSFFGYTTVTRHVVESQTRKMVDLANVVTFSVTGCEPSRLPFDLDFCGEAHRKKGTIAIKESLVHEGSTHVPPEATPAIDPRAGVVGEVVVDLEA
uniref:Uncharacterized protein n=1 Tax=Timema cristinae TaxID=61476 RepID=A0A7R9D4W2_TIMCR|nr:unnamed protein product [Timema cristinae]